MPKRGAPVAARLGSVMNIVMTGGTSGVGAHAVQVLRCQEGVRLMLGARNGEPGTLSLELSELSSVRAFASEVLGRLGDDRLDVLVLNAGIWRPTVDGRTPDGFETTFAVNHLAQYLLLRLLMPRLASGARVIFTSSGTHDPAQRTRMPPPHHADAELLAHPDRDPRRDAEPRVAGGRAYAASKLCNVLTARALAAEPMARQRSLVVIAWTPGPTPGTGLLREGPWPLRVLSRLLRSPLRHMFPAMNSARVAGRVLADLALGHTSPPPGARYGAVRRGRFTWCEPSSLARDDDAMRALWDGSARLLDLPPTSDPRPSPPGAGPSR